MQQGGEPGRNLGPDPKIFIIGFFLVMMLITIISVRAMGPGFGFFGPGWGWPVFMGGPTIYTGGGSSGPSDSGRTSGGSSGGRSGGSTFRGGGISGGRGGK